MEGRAYLGVLEYVLFYRYVVYELVEEINKQKNQEKKFFFC